MHHHPPAPNFSKSTPPPLPLLISYSWTFKKTFRMNFWIPRSQVPKLKSSKALQSSKDLKPLYSSPSILAWLWSSSHLLVLFFCDQMDQFWKFWWYPGHHSTSKKVLEVWWWVGSEGGDVGGDEDGDKDWIIDSERLGELMTDWWMMDRWIDIGNW